MKTEIKQWLFLALGVILVTGYTHAQTFEWTMKGNPLGQQVNGVAFRADGQKVVSGTNCHPASIRMFDVATSQLNWDFNVGMNYMCIMGVTFSSNSNYISAIEEFGNIFIFDNTGSLPVISDTILTGSPFAFCTAISPSNDRVAVGGSDGRLRVYSLPGGALMLNILAHPLAWVTSVSFSPNGNRILTGSANNQVRIWNSTTGSLVHTCTGHSDDVTSVKVTPNGNFVVSGSRDNTLRIWNLNTGGFVRSITGHSDDVNGVDVSPDGTRVVSASSDATCKIWDFNTGNLVSTFGVVDSGAVLTVAWAPVGNKIVTGNIRSDVTLWNASSALGIEASRESDGDLTIYPNPAVDFITIQIPQSTKQGSLRILNELGQSVQELIYSDDFLLKVPVNSLVNRVYFVEFLTENKKSISKLVINR
jgi:WD40 repeat protein